MFLDLASAIITIAAAVWVGAIVFQSVVVAPSVFAFLDEVDARAFLRGLFPRFFRFGLVCGAFILLAVVTLSIGQGVNGRLALLASLALGMLFLEAVSLGMVSHINAARDAGAAGAEKFDRLHRVSVFLTVAILLLGIWILVVVSTGSRLAASA